MDEHDEIEAGVERGYQNVIDRRIAERVEKEQVFEFLDKLRESGATNMFGAGPYVEEHFEFDHKKADCFVGEWMRTFSERHALEKEEIA